jgi:hypothetical protein
MTETAGVSFFQFVYRSNPDKTMDAICALCFTTVATAANEADLHDGNLLMFAGTTRPSRALRAADSAPLTLGSLPVKALSFCWAKCQKYRAGSS